MNEDEVVPSRISKVRKSIADLERKRHISLLEKHVIGKVSNKKRDLAGELAVIPKRVPFKWQRGNKIGMGNNVDLCSIIFQIFCILVFVRVRKL